MAKFIKKCNKFGLNLVILMKTKILIVDDHASFRDSLIEILKDYSNLEIVAEAENGQKAIDQTIEYKPDLIFMDIAMPTMNGFDATQTILKHFPNINIIFISMHTNQAYAKKAIQIGAKGFLIKRTLIRELEKALQSVLEDKVYISKEVQMSV